MSPKVYEDVKAAIEVLPSIYKPDRTGYFLQLLDHAGLEIKPKEPVEAMKETPMTKISLEDAVASYEGSPKQLQDEIERIIISRLYSKRIDGYTLEMAIQIMDTIATHRRALSTLAGEGETVPVEGKMTPEIMAWAESTFDVPEGWKLVPIEPTETMRAAANMRGPYDGSGKHWGAIYYTAMLAAAPSATNQITGERDNLQERLEIALRDNARQIARNVALMAALRPFARFAYGRRSLLNEGSDDSVFYGGSTGPYLTNGDFRRAAGLLPQEKTK